MIYRYINYSLFNEFKKIFISYKKNRKEHFFITSSEKSM
jgi:hypothetical protein